MAEVIVAVVTVVGTLLGVVVGWRLTSITDEKHAAQQAEHQRQNVQTLVRLEIDQNIKMLDEFWRGVTELPQPIAQPDPGYEQEEFDFTKRRRLVETALPPLSRLMFESQAGLLAEAIPDRDILTRTYELYQSLNEFGIARSSLHEDLLVADEFLFKSFDAWTDSKRYNAQRGTAKSLQMEAPELAARLRTINQRTFNLFAECEGIINRLRTQGNPLKK